MDSHDFDTHKYPNLLVNQPGLEVGHPPQLVEHNLKWPDESHPVRGMERIAYEEKVERESKPRTILGLSVGVFWGIVVLLCLLIAGGIGGGVGAGLAGRKDTCSSINHTISSANAESQICPTSTPITTTTTQTITQSGSATTSSSTSSVSPAPFSHCKTSTTFNESSLHPLDATGNPIQLGTVEQTFEVLCNTNFPGGAADKNPGVHDTMKIYQPDLLRCVSACAEYNAGYQGNADAGVSVGGGLCRAVSLVLAEGEFCYLKNGTGINDTSTSEGNRIDSAVLE